MPSHSQLPWLFVCVWMTHRRVEIYLGVKPHHTTTERRQEQTLLVFGGGRGVVCCSILRSRRLNSSEIVCVCVSHGGAYREGGVG